MLLPWPPKQNKHQQQQRQPSATVSNERSSDRSSERSSDRNSNRGNDRSRKSSSNSSTAETEPTTARKAIFGPELASSRSCAHALMSSALMRSSAHDLPAHAFRAHALTRRDARRLAHHSALRSVSASLRPRGRLDVYRQQAHGEGWSAPHHPG